MVASTAYHGALEQCRKAAILQSDADMLQAFPMVYHANQSPLRESLPYEAVKELRNSLRDYGTQPTFTHNLLVAIAGSYVLTPYDGKILLRTVLSPI